MDVARQVKKPTTQRGKRFVENRAPKLVENDKSTLFVRGGHVSSQITSCLKDLYQLKKPEATLMRSLNPFHPFDDESGLEKYAQKYDCSLFAFGSHSKKRPHNLILGRLYDSHIFDMFELGMENFKSLNEFKTVSAPLGCKPCLSFNGDAFQQDEAMKRLKNFFIDFFRCQSPEKVRLQGLEVLISFTALMNKVVIKTHRILLKKSGTRVPRVELQEMGPSMDVVLRRKKLASDELYKHACRQPKATKIAKVKNISHDVFGSKLARVHITQQNLRTLQTRKMKGLKRKFDGNDETHENQNFGEEKRIRND